MLVYDGPATSFASTLEVTQSALLCRMDMFPSYCVQSHTEELKELKGVKEFLYVSFFGFKSL